jgi:hypothetical protein
VLCFGCNSRYRPQGKQVPAKGSILEPLGIVQPLLFEEEE